MLRLLIDENFDQRILRGLRLRLPQLDYLIVQQAGMSGPERPGLTRLGRDPGPHHNHP